MDLEKMNALVLSYGMKAVAALVVLLVGLFISNLIVKYMGKFLDKKNVEASLKPFLTSVLGWMLKAAVFIAAVNTAGFETTSFIALLGTAGLAIGMALQGSLSNFAGGVLILLLKPFKVGDVISAQGFTGSVSKITAFSTVLKTADNQIIVIPNGALANSAVVNINHEQTRRVDFTFGVSYNDNITKVRETLLSIVESESRILKDPKPVIVLGELGESAVNFYVRAWVETADYWGVYFDITEKVKLSFDQEKISFPYPQTDVHIHQLQ